MLTGVVLACSTVVLGVLALGVVGTFLPEVPMLGLATGFVSPVLTWVIAVAVLCGAAALAVRWRRGGRYPAVLVVVATVIALAATLATAQMVSAVEEAGADIDLIDTLGVFAADDTAPDVSLPYAEYDGRPLNVSVYRPVRAVDGGAPVLVFIHGGGWVAGSRTAHSADLRWFAEQGWLTVTVDYPLSSSDRHLWDVVQDRIGCALAWVVRNAAGYGGNPDRLSLTGDSAGGNLAINTAYLSVRNELESSCGGTVPVVSAVSVLYPAVDPADVWANPDFALGDTSRSMAEAYTGGAPDEVPDRYRAIASQTHLSPRAPPTLIIVGEEDHLVPVGATYRFADAARAQGVTVEVVSVPHADHVFDARTGSIGQQAYRQLTAQWLREHGQGP